MNIVHLIKPNIFEYNRGEHLYGFWNTIEFSFSIEME